MFTITSESDALTKLTDATLCPILHSLFTVTSTETTYGYDIDCVAKDNSNVKWSLPTATNSQKKPAFRFYYNGLSSNYTTNTMSYPIIYDEVVCSDCTVIMLRNDTGTYYQSIIVDSDWYIMTNNTNNAPVNIFNRVGTSVEAYGTNLIKNYLDYKKSLGQSLADEWIAQPIYIRGKNSPLYSVTMNSESTDPSIASKFVIDNQAFLSVSVLPIVVKID